MSSVSPDLQRPESECCIIYYIVQWACILYNVYCIMYIVYIYYIYTIYIISLSLNIVVYLPMADHGAPAVSTGKFPGFDRLSYGAYLVNFKKQAIAGIPFSGRSNTFRVRYLDNRQTHELNTIVVVRMICRFCRPAHIVVVRMICRFCRPAHIVVVRMICRFCRPAHMSTTNAHVS